MCGEDFIIYKFNMNNLLLNGKINDQNKTLDCSKAKVSFEMIKKSMNMLFDQTIKVTSKESFSQNFFKQIYIIIDFTNFKDSSNLYKIENGIILNIDGMIITFKDFLKSASMSRANQAYYINQDYYNILKRISFGMDSKDVALSKWYAYTGLELTDVDILSELNLSSDEIIVVDDYESGSKDNFITAISIATIKNLAKNISKGKNNVLDEIDEYLTAEEFKSNQTSVDLDLINSIVNGINDKSKTKDYNLDDLFKLLEFLRNYLIDDINEEYKTTLQAIIDIVLPIPLEWLPITINDKNSLVNLFDGEGIISFELRDEINKLLNKNYNFSDENSDEFNEENNALFDSIQSEESNANSFQIRMPFIKGVVHSIDLKQFFKEHNITRIKGKTYCSENEYMDYDATKVKMILTESMFKAAKFISNLDEDESLKKCHDSNSRLKSFLNICNYYDYHLSIANTEPAQSSKVKFNYQFLSTLPLSLSEWEKTGIIEREIELLKQNLSDENMLKQINYGDYYQPDRAIYNANNAYYLNTSRYKERKKKYMDSLKDSVMLGQIHIYGSRKYLSGDLLDLLYRVCDLTLESGRIPRNEIYAPGSNLEYNKHVLMFRNPHFVRNEIVVCKPTMPTKERKKYLSHLSSVVMFDSRYHTHERLGGADFDGDTAIIVNERSIVKYACPKLLCNKNNKVIPKYSLIKIPSLNPINQSFKNYNNRMNSFINTFNNQVGLISNIAFNTVYLGYLSNKKDSSFAMYTILGGLEIDSAKNGIKPLISKNKYKNKSIFLDFKESIKTGNRKKSSKCEDGKNTSNKINVGILEKLINDFDNLNVINKLPKQNSFEIPKKKPTDSTIKAYVVYKQINNFINRSKYGSSNNLDDPEELSMVKNEIIKILNDNGYDNIDCLFDVINELPDNSFNDYFSTNFHFKTDLSDKIKSIKKVTDIDDKLANFFVKFENNGYRLLYYYLFLASHTGEKKINKPQKDLITIDLLNEEFKDSKSLCFNDDFVKECNELYNQVLNRIDWESEDLIKMNQLVSIMKPYFDSKMIEEIQSLCDLKNSSMVFNVLNDSMCKYLEEKK